MSYFDIYYELFDTSTEKGMQTNIVVLFKIVYYRQGNFSTDKEIIDILRNDKDRNLELIEYLKSRLVDSSEIEKCAKLIAELSKEGMK
jgi:hypothetical protein